jgi:CRP-like cAMP-binding protein
MRLRAMRPGDAATVTGNGWLARQPERFRDEVLRRVLVEEHPAGAAFYHLGDPVGGIYGLVAGLLTVTTAPGSALPRLIHLGPPGTWTGEGPYMTGEPRRVRLGAAVESRVLYLPLEAMEDMTARDPEAARRFGQIPLLNIDTLLRIIHDLLLKDPDRRIGAVLLRAAGGGATVPLGQAEIGDMACASRKQVNFALRRFAAAGWARPGYRSVTIADPAALRAFVAAEDEG